MKALVTEFEKQLLTASGVLVCAILLVGCSARGDVFTSRYQPTPAPTAAPAVAPAQPQVIVIESGPAPAPIIMPAPDYMPLAIALLFAVVVFGGLGVVALMLVRPRPVRQPKATPPPALAPGQIDPRIIVIASKSDSELAALGYDPAQVRAAVARQLPASGQLPPARRIGGGQ